MNLVLVNVPYWGNRPVNIAYAMLACADVIERGHIPLCPSLLRCQHHMRSVDHEFLRGRIGSKCPMVWSYIDLGVNDDMVIDDEVEDFINRFYGQVHKPKERIKEHLFEQLVSGIPREHWHTAAGDYGVKWLHDQPRSITSAIEVLIRQDWPIETKQFIESILRGDG